MNKARLYHFAVVATLVVCALIAALAVLPRGMYDGAD